MKLSAVGDTKAVLFEPENKREAKRLNNYMANQEFFKTKQSKTNIGVAGGTLVLSYLAMMVGTFAKKAPTTIVAAILSFAGMATSLAFSIKQMLNLKKFKEAQNAPQQEQATQTQGSQEQTVAKEATQA